jgi:hypothetical protein
MIIKTTVLGPNATQDKRIKATDERGNTLTDAYHTQRSNLEGSERHAEVAMGLVRALHGNGMYRAELTGSTATAYTFRVTTA